jgi:hypothetical protein
MVYKKPETTLKVVDALRKSAVKNLYISINAPLKYYKEDIFKNYNVINIVKNINWDCVVKYKIRRKYVDAYTSYNEAIKWFFKNEKEGIILEDDTLPNNSFFLFCSQLLKKYRNNKKIAQICGSSFLNQKNIGKTNYFFSNYSLCWGYATWRRSINDYDEHMKEWPIIKKNKVFISIINDKKFLSYWTDIFDIQYKKKFRAWDYRWLYSNWVKKKLSIIPKKHLIQNIGFVKEATHTKIKYKDWFHDLKTEEINEIKYHPSPIQAEINYDKWLSYKVFNVNKFYIKKIIENNKIYKILKSFLK